MANSKDHILGDLHNFLRAVKTAGFTDVRVGPMTDSATKRVVPISTLQAALESLRGISVTLRMAGNSLEVADSDGQVVATLTTNTA